MVHDLSLIHILIRCFFDQFSPQLLRLFQHIRRDFLDFHLGSQIIRIEDRVHFQQVDDAAECVFLSLIHI